MLKKAGTRQGLSFYLTVTIYFHLGCLNCVIISSFSINLSVNQNFLPALPIQHTPKYSVYCDVTFYHKHLLNSTLFVPPITILINPGLQPVYYPKRETHLSPNSTANLAVIQLLHHLSLQFSILIKVGGVLLRNSGCG